MGNPSEHDHQPAAQELLSASRAPLAELREAVLEAAHEVAGAAAHATLGAASEGAKSERADGRSRGRKAISLERPPRAQFGDYSTNAALLLAPGLSAPPREVAERLGRRSPGAWARGSRATRWRAPAF